MKGPKCGLLLLFPLTMVSVSIAIHSRAQEPNKILIGSASNLQFALDSIVTVFKQIKPGTVDIAYGSSGKLFEQISNGAPFDLYFSADMSYPRKLKKNGFALSEVYLYSVGRIVLWSKKINPQKEGMKSLQQSSIKKVAIANPAHAPYGKRAEEALIYYNLLASVKEKLVYGENISQTAQFVTAGAADIGIVALSLALSPNMKKEGGRYYLIPESSHQPLEQGAVITRHAKGNEYANAFLEFMKGETAKAILNYFGFSKP